MRFAIGTKYVCGILILTVAAVTAFNLSDRRSFINQVSAATTTGISISGIAPQIAIADDTDDIYADFTTTESGLKYKVTKEGTGAVPQAGQTVKAHYTGWLDGFDSIRKFDSSRDRGRPFSFRVGAGQVIRG